MSLKVNEASILNNRNINFLSNPPKEEKTQKSEEPKKEKAFYERNKKAIWALSAIGVAAIALGTHHYIKSRNITDVAESATGKISKSEKTFNEFKEKINLLGDNDDATDIIKTALAEDNPILKLKTVDLLLKDKGKHINGNNWEDIFNSLIEIRPTESIKPEKISSKLNELYDILEEKDIVNTEVIDKIITKLPEASDDVKLNLSQKLIDDIYKDGKLIKSKLNKEQSKKILDILDNVKQETFNYHTNEYVRYKDYSTSGLKYNYNNKIYTEAEIDNNYITNFKNLLNSNSLSDNDKLQLIDDIYYSKLIKKENHTKEDMELIKEMLKSFEKNNAETYSIPNQNISLSFKHDKFALNARLFDYATSNDNFNVFTTEEKLKIAQSLKEASKKVKLNTEDIGSNAHYINNIYAKELDLKSKNFFEKITPETTINDINKFVEDILDGYKEAQKHFLKSSIIMESDKNTLMINFLSFKLDTYLLLLKKQSECLSKYDNQGFKQINEIVEKINKFGYKYFKTGEDKYKTHSWEENSNDNISDFLDSKTQEAKSKLLDFLKKDNALKEFAEIVENNKLDKNTLKNIKRKFVIKYHPDKAKDDNQRAEFTRIFQEINNSIEILEKTL